MGARVSTDYDSHRETADRRDRKATVPRARAVANVLTALLRVIALASLGAFVITAAQAAAGTTSPVKCLHFLQYAAELTCWCVLMSQAKRALMEIAAEGTPFPDNLSLRTRRIAALLLALTLLGMLFSFIGSWLCYGVAPSLGGISMGYAGFPDLEVWQAIAEHASSISVSQTGAIPLGSLMLPCATMFLSLAMERGQQLQREHDETL